MQPTGQPRTRHKPPGQPTSPSTMQPADQPTGPPSLFPTSRPASPLAISLPTPPTVQPSSFSPYQPIDHPTGQPTTKPTSLLTSQPTGQPTGQPPSLTMDQPTDPPTCPLPFQPTSLTTSQPTDQPTRQPSTLVPTDQPTDQPTGQSTTQRPSLPTSHTGAGAFSIRVHSHVRPQKLRRAVLGPVPTCSVHDMEAELSSRLIATPSKSVRSEHLDILYQTADVSSGAGVFSIRVHSPVRPQKLRRAVLGPVPPCSVHNMEAEQS